MLILHNTPSPAQIYCDRTSLYVWQSYFLLFHARDFLQIKYIRKCKVFRNFKHNLISDRIHKFFLTIYSTAETHIKRNLAQNSNRIINKSWSKIYKFQQYLITNQNLKLITSQFLVYWFTNVCSSSLYKRKSTLELFSV